MTKRTAQREPFDEELGRMAKGRKNYTREERARRAARMRRLNESGAAGARYGRLLGGRPRKGESREEALARRRKALDEAQNLVGKPKPPVTVKAQPKLEPELTDEQAQVLRAFRKRPPASSGQLVRSNPESYWRL